MKNRKISNDKLKEMRNFLPQGSNKIIAGNTGHTPIYVSKVLHGVNLNLKVIDEALKIAMEEKAVRESLNTKLDNLINNASHDR